MYVGIPGVHTNIHMYVSRTYTPEIPTYTCICFAYSKHTHQVNQHTHVCFAHALRAHQVYQHTHFWCMFRARTAHTCMCLCHIFQMRIYGHIYYVYTCKCIHIYLRIFAFVWHICRYIYMCTYIYSTCVYVDIFVCVYTYTHLFSSV